MQLCRRHLADITEALDTGSPTAKALQALHTAERAAARTEE